MNFKIPTNARGNPLNQNGSSGLPPSMTQRSSDRWYEIPTFRGAARAFGSFLGLKSESLDLFEQESASRGIEIFTYDNTLIDMGIYSRRFGKNNSKIRICVPDVVFQKLDSLLSSGDLTTQQLENAFWFMSEHFFKKTHFDKGPERIVNETVVYQMRRARYFEMAEKALRDLNLGIVVHPPAFSTPTVSLHPENMKLVQDYLTVKAFLDDPIKISISERIHRETPITFTCDEYDNLKAKVIANVSFLRRPPVSLFKSLSKTLHVF